MDISRKGTFIGTIIDKVTRVLVVLLVVLVVPPAVAAQGETDWARLNVAAREHAKTTIRAGVPGVRPFWNAHAKAFIHPPAFEFQEVEGAIGALRTTRPTKRGSRPNRGSPFPPTSGIR